MTIFSKNITIVTTTFSPENLVVTAIFAREREREATHRKSRAKYNIFFREIKEYILEYRTSNGIMCHLGYFACLKS